MKQNNTTRQLLIKHFEAHPKLELQDIFKYLHQSTFGCEHMVTDKEKAISYITSEFESYALGEDTKAEALDGEFSRVHFSYLKDGLSAETLGELFYKSGQIKTGTISSLKEKLAVARELTTEGILPFSEQAFDKAVSDWETSGFSALHHSEIFRSTYKPSYRVISNIYVPFLDLFTEIDKLLKSKDTVKIAIEGRSASGKSTLSEALEEIYDCNIFHIDDFFLRPEQRTAQRFKTVGANFDKERFLETVVTPLSENRSFNYRKFDCSTMSLGETVSVVPKKLNIVEGVYSMHPELSSIYDFSVFLDISCEHQKARILKRNLPETAAMFFDRWIPLENTYFSQMQVKSRCSMCIQVI